MKTYESLIFYISGPMRGKPDFNYPTFVAVKEELFRQYPGCKVLCPTDNFDGDKTREVTDYLTADLDMVLKATEIVLLPGWETSEGAKREIDVAKWTGKAFWLAQECVRDYPSSRKIVPGWSFVMLSEPPVLETSPRQSALEEARDLITGDRNNQYGPPTQDFDRTAGMASAYGFRVNGRELRGHDVAIFMMLLKTSRLAWTPTKRDSWVDNAGYSGCGYECAMAEEEAEKPREGMTRDEMEAALARWTNAMDRWESAA